MKDEREIKLMEDNEWQNDVGYGGGWSSKIRKLGKKYLTLFLNYEK